MLTRLTVGLALLAAGGVHARPNYVGCSFQVGGRISGMGRPTIEAANGNECKITTNIPAQGYTAGKNYDITVTASAFPRKGGSAGAGMRMACNVGKFGSDGNCAMPAQSRAEQAKIEWTAPGAGSGKVTFRNLCGHYTAMKMASNVAHEEYVVPLSKRQEDFCSTYKSRCADASQGSAYTDCLATIKAMPEGKSAPPHAHVHAGPVVCAR